MYAQITADLLCAKSFTERSLQLATSNELIQQKSTR